ncbi:MAG: phosphonate C-P lyase system protein PhnG [Rhodospirillales bacterium]|jgi:alpha-D-ribose 1-methylphosphonate 5-triphosphate synthase subunit PhnG|nr:phosphonate C-P lyase system protein PhnG [Magnetospirillum sp.]
MTVSVSDPAPVGDAANAARQRWMRVLAKALPGELAAACAALGQMPRAAFVRPPETGLALLRGRIGGRGAPFNFGEATVTRCVVRLAGDAAGPMGFGYVMGRDKNRAEQAALLDALLQRGNAEAARQIDRLEAAQAARVAAQAAHAATSKVDFFTLVRE